MLHTIRILSHISRWYFTLLIVPLTSTCTMHLTTLPITLIFVCFSIKCTTTFQYIVYKLSLVVCTITVFKFTISIPITIYELSWVCWSILILLDTISIFHPLTPLSLIHEKWLKWFKNTITWWFIFLPISIISLALIIYVKTFSIFHVVFPLSFIVVTIMWEKQPKTIFLISSNLCIADKNSISYLKFLQIFRLNFFNYIFMISTIEFL